MFTIVASPRAWWPVEFLGVTEEGEVVTNQIKMQFMLLKTDEVADFQSKSDEMGKQIEARLKASDDMTASGISVELVKLVACNWRDVGIEGQGEVPWNDENLRALVNVPNALDGIMTAFRDCMAARKSVHQGN